MSEATAEYEVGYARPPRRTQFKKGQSGNPSGRPKRSESFPRLVRQALDEEIVVNQNGKRRRISKLEAGLTQLVNKAVRGDPRAVRDFVRLQGDLARQEPKKKEREIIVRTIKHSELKQRGEA